jgi:hypothetical protein
MNTFIILKATEEQLNSLELLKEILGIHKYEDILNIQKINDEFHIYCKFYIKPANSKLICYFSKDMK